jgi:hypothetical protein
MRLDKHGVNPVRLCMLLGIACAVSRSQVDLRESKTTKLLSRK